MSWVYDGSLACRVLIGTVFIVSVASKAHSRKAWRAYVSWLAGLPLKPLGRSGAPGVLAGAEAAVVVLVAVPAAAVAGLGVAAMLSLALTVGLFLAVRRGARQPCYCFGASSDSLGGQHVARNALLAALAVAGTLVALAGPGRTARPAEGALAVIFGLALALLIIFFSDVAALLRPDEALPGAFPSGPHARPR